MCVGFLNCGGRIRFRNGQKYLCSDEHKWPFDIAGRLVSVQRSRQSADESANRERESEAGLSEAKGIRRQPPATGERRACERQAVDGALRGVPRNAPELGKVFDDFHKETVARLAWPVSGNEFRIHGILGSLGIPANGERDGVCRIAAEIVADKIDREWRDGAVAEFDQSEAQSSSEEPRNGNVLADSPRRGLVSPWEAGTDWAGRGLDSVTDFGKRCFHIRAV